MATRQQMLERVGKALGKKTEVSEISHSPFDSTGIMPPLAPEDYQTKFAAEWEKVAGVCHVAATVEELAAIVQGILSRWPKPSVVVSRNPLLAELHIADRLRSAGQSVTVWENGPMHGPPPASSDFQEASFQAQVGITGVDYVLAESGTLVLSSATEGAMITSLAPPAHVAVYRRSQLVGSLDDLLAKLPISPDPTHPTVGRSVVLITGTSRTADIEQILIRGVHGPGEAHAILVEESWR